MSTSRRTVLKTAAAAALSVPLIPRLVLGETGKIPLNRKLSIAAIGTGRQAADHLDESELFNPGETVPKTGIYEVFHDNLDGHEHAPRHWVTASQGMVFPRCRVCHEHVKFRLLPAADPLDAHDYFRH